MKNATPKEKREIVKTRIVDALDARDMATSSDRTDLVLQLRTKRGNKIIVSEAIIPHEAIRDTNMYDYVIVCAFDMMAEKHGKELKGEG